MKKLTTIYWKQIELQSAPAFVLLILLFLAFSIANLLHLSTYASLTIAAIFAAGASIFLYCQKKILSYLLFSLTIGFLFFVISDNNNVSFSGKIAPKSKAIMCGKVVQIIRHDSAYSRYVISGWFDSKNLPKIENTGIILNIYGQNHYQLGSQILTNCNIRPAQQQVLPTDFDELNYAKSMNAAWIATTSTKNTVLYCRENTAYSIRNTAYNSLQNQINTLFLPQNSALLNAMLLGDKSNIDPTIRKAFSTIGIAHILAISGLHVGIIMAVFAIFLVFIPNRYVKMIIFSFLLLAFVFLVGMPASALRAATMAILYMLSQIVQRDANPLNIISVVIIGAALFSPNLLHSIGFQLSALSVLSIFLFKPIFDRFLLIFFNVNENSTIYPFIIGLAITMSVSVFLNPIIAYYFHSFSIISTFANMIIIPLFSLALVLAVVALICSVFCMPLANIYAKGVEFLFDISTNFADIMANFKFSALKGDNAFIITVAILFSIVLIYIFSSIQKRQLAFRFAASTVICVIILIFFNNRHLPRHTKIYPKEAYCLLSIPLTNNEHAIWIADRKPYQNYYYDRALSDYINDKSRNIKYIFYNGSYGDTFVKRLNNNAIKSRTLDFSEQRELEKRYLKSQYISTTIDSK